MNTTQGRLLTHLQEGSWKTFLTQCLYSWLYGMILAVGTGFKTTRWEETEYFVSRSVPSPSVSVNGEFPVHDFHFLLFLFVSHLLASRIDLMSVESVSPVPSLCLVASSPPSSILDVLTCWSLPVWACVCICVESACDECSFDLLSSTAGWSEFSSQPCLW